MSSHFGREGGDEDRTKEDGVLADQGAGYRLVESIAQGPDVAYSYNPLMMPDMFVDFNVGEYGGYGVSGT